MGVILNVLEQKEEKQRKRVKKGIKVHAGTKRSRGHDPRWGGSMFFLYVEEKLQGIDTVVV